MKTFDINSPIISSNSTLNSKIEFEGSKDDLEFFINTEVYEDLTKNDNEKVFIFNGWTFASDPSLTPFDHAIYDLQLLNCSKA